MRMLFLGGTGFIGPHQVAYALERGHEVTIFRRGRGRLPPQLGGVEQLHGDRAAGDLRALSSRSWDVCIDNPACLPGWVRDSTHRLAGRVGRYIFVSSISVYADTHLPVVEDGALASYRGADPYAETTESLRADPQQLFGPLKALCESEVARRFGGAAVIVRPGLIAGPGDPTDRFTYWAVRLRRGGAVLAPGTWEDPVQFIDARDLAEWIVRLAEQGATGTFNATGPAAPMTLGPFLTRLREAIGSDACFTWVRSRFLERQGLAPWTDLPLWLPGTGDAAGLMRADIREAVRAGLTFRPLACTAADTLDWFDRQPAERRATLRAGLPDGREQRALDAWKAEIAACAKNGS